MEISTIQLIDSMIQNRKNVRSLNFTLVESTEWRISTLPIEVYRAALLADRESGSAENNRLSAWTYTCGVTVQADDDDNITVSIDNREDLGKLHLERFVEDDVEDFTFHMVPSSEDLAKAVNEFLEKIVKLHLQEQDEKNHSMVMDVIDKRK